MRRPAHVLAATAIVAVLGLTALPATASTLAVGATVSQSRTATSATQSVARRGQLESSTPTPAQVRALTRAEQIQTVAGERGAITGIVRGANGAPQANVCVTASGPAGAGTAFSRPGGRFLISGLRLGAYRVQYRGCSPIGRFVGQWYGGLSRGSATQVLVTAGLPVSLAAVTLGEVAPRSAIQASTPLRPASPGARLFTLLAEVRSGALARAGAAATAGAAGRNARISGRVTSRAGRPLKGICVLADQVGGGRQGGASFVALTSKSGGYTIGVRQAGRYHVVFLSACAASGNFAPQLWKDAGSIGAAGVLVVRRHQAVTHIDAVLGIGASITGRVRSSHQHGSFAGICVFAMGTGGQRLFEGAAIARANGTFRMPSLATGKYRLQFFNGCGPQSTYLPLTLRRPVAVTDGKTTSGVRVSLRLGGAITGTVTDAAGHPLSGICVTASTFGSGILLGLGPVTSASGTYRAGGLPTGRYQMQFSTGCGNNGSYAALTLPKAVAVTAGKTTAGINATMQLAGTISGVVRNSGGGTLSGICVEAFDASTQGFAFVSTSASGKYRAKDLPPGEYQVQFVPGGVFSNCGNNGNYLPATLSTTVASGKVASLDAVLPTGGVVSGVVRDSRHHRVGGICVVSSSPDGNQVITAPNGAYSMTQLFSGSFDIGFLGGCGNAGSVAPQAYHGDPTFDAPIAVPVTAGRTTAGIDAALRPGGTITGHITDLAGRPLSRICVFTNAMTGAGGTGDFGNLQASRDGRYRAVNLAPGQYTVSFGGVSSSDYGCAPSGRYADQDFQARTTGAISDLVSVPGGVTTRGIDAALAPAGSIGGTIRSRAGHPVSFTCVTATDRRTHAAGMALAGGHGTYVLTDIPAGRYQVEFTQCESSFGGPGPNYASQWYRNRPSEKSATTVVVRAAHTAPHIDAALTRGGSITGQVVYGPDNRPVSSVCVFAVSDATANMGLTDRDGRYVITGLSTGHYQMEFDPCSAENGLAGRIRPALVDVVAGRTVRGIDARVRVGGSVSGVVSARTAHGRAPAPGACVLIVPLSESNVPFVTTAGLGGSYLATNLAPGTYVTYFGAPSCSNDSPALAPRFVVGQVRVIARQTVAGPDVTLQPDGGISGVVRGAGDRPLAGICAEVLPVNGGAGAVIGVSASGRYSVTDLVPGRYRVRFEAGCGASGYATRWYKNARTRQRATVVQVSAGKTRTGISITLARS